MGCGASHPTAIAVPSSTAGSVPKAVNTAGSAVVDKWLASIGLEEYGALFKDAGFDDMATVAELAKADLATIGVIKTGHVKKLLKHAEMLGEKQSVAKKAAAAGPASGKTLPASDAPKIELVPGDTSALAPQLVLRSEDPIPPKYQSFVRNGTQYRIYKKFYPANAPCEDRSAGQRPKHTVRPRAAFTRAQPHTR